MKSWQEYVIPTVIEIGIVFVILLIAGGASTLVAVSGNEKEGIHN